MKMLIDGVLVDMPDFYGFPLPQPPRYALTPTEFLRRFQDEELLRFIERGGYALLLFIKAACLSEIDVSSPIIKQAVNSLVLDNLLAAERAAEVLQPAS